MGEFTIPDFLANNSPEEVFAKMKSILPADIDLSEGGHAYNMTMPTALIAAELCEFILPEVVKLILPEHSYGSILDGHAEARGLTRRSASAATGTLTIIGEPGTVIQAGSLFSTAAVNDEPSVDYAVTIPVIIPSEGTISVNVQCTETGIIGNAQANTIILVSSRITGITSVTNPEAMTGGTEQETDEALIERIMEYDRSQGANFVGSVSDYKRWASSVPGVGNANVQPAQDTSGLVTIIVTDANGEPATEQLCDAVYNYIMKPDAPEERLAPINALLSVEPAVKVTVVISAEVILAEGATVEGVTEKYITALKAYLQTAQEEQVIRYSKIGALLASVTGVSDYESLQLSVDSGTVGMANIALDEDELPTVTVDSVTLTVAEE